MRAKRRQGASGAASETAAVRRQAGRTHRTAAMARPSPLRCEVARPFRSGNHAAAAAAPPPAAPRGASRLFRLPSGAPPVDRAVQRNRCRFAACEQPRAFKGRSIDSRHLRGLRRQPKGAFVRSRAEGIWLSGVVDGCTAGITIHASKQEPHAGKMAEGRKALGRKSRKVPVRKKL